MRLLILLVSAAAFTVQALGFHNAKARLIITPTSRLKIQQKMSLLMSIRGGSVSNLLKLTAQNFQNSPTSLFNNLLLSLSSVAIAWKGLERIQRSKSNKEVTSKPSAVASLQVRFLIVFWLLRMADWLQGPYFYEVYSSKIINGAPVGLDLVSKLFLVGFASTGIFGPYVGRLVDTYGRRAGTLVFAFLYSLGALSTLSSSLTVLLAGRIAGGIGTSLLFSAPEAWLVGESMRQNFDPSWLGQTFGLAYAGDSLVAITAGQLASIAAGKNGPSGPFVLSLGFLALGSIIASLKWGENLAPTPTSESGVPYKKPSIKDAWDMVVKDKKILLVGSVQAFFEGAMYIFVLQWPPAIKKAIAASKWIGSDLGVPFGKIFSCFMACCLLGSSIFGALQIGAAAAAEPNPTVKSSFLKGFLRTESTTCAMLLVATLSMTVASAAVAGVASLGLPALIAAFFAFEACVGMYFPSIGTLRSKYVPDSHRSVIMNIFGVPLNLIVVSVFLSMRNLGVTGAMGVATGALGVATVCATVLSVITNKK